MNFMKLTHKFQDEEDFRTAINHIESLAPEKGGCSYLIKFDLQEFLEPLKYIFVEINYRVWEMIFRGNDERAVRALYYDCTPQP